MSQYFEAGRHKAFCPEDIDPAISTVLNRMRRVRRNQVTVTVLTSLKTAHESAAKTQSNKAAGTHLTIRLANGSQIDFECANPEQFALQALSLKAHRAQGGCR